MDPTRAVRLTAAVLAALCLTFGVAACSKKETGSEEEPAREGLAVEVGGINYNIGITRELNLRIAPDKAYYTGKAAPPGQIYYGVFLKACGAGRRTLATSDFQVRDNQGNTYRPKMLPPTNAFSYQPRELSEKQCIPQPGSVAQQGPTAGAMLLFQFPLQNTENRPLVMRISGVNPDTRKIERKYIDLDL